MINTDNKALTHKRQVEKNKFVHRKEETNNFLLYCQEYSRFISKVKNSPWRKNSNPLYNLKASGLKNLGPSQVKMVYFLYEFFKKGKPVYFSYQNISKATGINQTNLSKVLKSLEDRNIITKENFKSINKGGKHQVVLLPNIPLNPFNFQSFFMQRLLDQTNKGYLTKQINSLCNYSKIKRNFRSNPSLTINTKEDFKSYYIGKRISLKTNSISSIEESSVGSFDSCLKDKEKKPMRLKLKHKPKDFEQSNKKETLLNKFKQRKKPLDTNKKILEVKEVIYKLIEQKKENRYLDTKTFNSLRYLLENKYGFDYSPKTLLSLKDLNTINCLIDNKVLFRFFDLLQEDRKLEFVNTIKTINYWNELGKNNKKIICTRPEKTSKTFKKIEVMVSYFMIYHSVNDIKKAIDRFHKFMGSTPYNYKKKISLLEFLTNPTDHKYLSTFLLEKNDGSLYRSGREPITKYPDAQKRWKEMIEELFVDRDDAKKYYAMFQYKIYDFLDKIIDRVKKFDLDLCDYKLLCHVDEEEESIMDMYLSYVCERTHSNTPMIKDICSEYYWDNFVDGKMRDEEGLTDFFKPAQFIDNYYDEYGDYGESY